MKTQLVLIYPSLLFRKYQGATTNIYKQIRFSSNMKSYTEFVNLNKCSFIHQGTEFMN